MQAGNVFIVQRTVMCAFFLLLFYVLAWAIIKKAEATKIFMLIVISEQIAELAERS